MVLLKGGGMEALVAFIAFIWNVLLMAAMCVGLWAVVEIVNWLTASPL